MATKAGPRSATDATRFTSTTPHAASKLSSTSPTAAAASSTRILSSSSPKGPPGRLSGETPEERVRRLRAAHQAARAAQTSGVDRVIGGGRRLFDFAHKFAVLGLVGFTAIAGVVSVYSVYDMVTYNKQRRADFIEAQHKMEEDSLAAARLAFISGTATDAQINLVEEANARARETGVKLPPLLSAPTVTTQAEKIFGTGQQHARQTQQEEVWGNDASTSSAAPSYTTTTTATTATTTTTPHDISPKKTNSWWPFSSGTSSTRSDASESLSEEDESAGVRPTDLARAVDERKEFLQNKAKAAFERERENQRWGGPLDQVGLPQQEEKKPEKKRWW